MVMVTCQCCICGGNIKDAHKLDPCFLTINTNIDGDDEEQLEQGFFCHYECFKEVMDYDGHLNLEGQEEYVARGYLRAGKYEKAIDIYEKLLPEAVEPKSVQSLLPNMIQCYKQRKDVAKQKASLEHGLELCNQGHESAGVYYEAAALAYASNDFQRANDYIKKYKNTFEIEIPEDSEERSEFENKYFGAIIALHLSLDEHETARSMCADWLDEFSEYEPTTREEAEASNPVDSCIQYLKDANLMFRLAASNFLRSSTPSLEFACKGIAEVMLGNDEKAHQEFLKYKRIFKEQVENQGEDFGEVWEELKSIPQDVQDFEIPDSDPPLSILVDDYIEKYGK